MKFLVIVKNLYDFPGGAEKSLLTLTKKLSKNNDIKAIYLSDNNRPFIDDNIEFFPVKGEMNTLKKPILTLKSIIKFLSKALSIAKKSKPNYIITQIKFIPLAITVARYFNIKSIIFLRSYESICFKGFKRYPCENMKCFLCTETLRERIFYSLIWLKTQWLRWALKNASLVIANSKFVRDVFKEYLNINSKIIYPFVNFNEIISNDIKSKKYITFITPRILKGLDIFIEIAKRLPDRKFLVAGVGYEEDQTQRLHLLKNVNYLGKVDDMRKVYSDTRILIVPSIWPEPFGRVCVEAIANGIPCIASNVGGIKEAIGDYGILIDDPFDIDSWVNTIERLSDEKTYKYFSQKGKRIIRKLNLEKGINLFLEVLQSTFPNRLQ